MGMYDTTCAITNLPIYKPDQDCRFFFLRKSLLNEPFDYGCGWALTSLPVVGKYNGYGIVSGVKEDAVTRLQVETLARRARPIDPSKLRGFEAAEGFPNTISSLMWACERGLLQLEIPSGLKDEETVVVSTAPMYVLEEAYQAVVEGDDQTPPIGLSRGKILRSRTKDPVEGLREACASLPTELSHIQDLLLSLASREFSSHVESTPDIFVLGGSTLKTADLRSYPSLSSFKDEDWTLLSREVLNLQVFFWTMQNELRRDLHPVTHTDQFYFPDQGLTAHQMLAHFIMRWCIETEEDEIKAQGEEK